MGRCVLAPPSRSGHPLLPVPEHSLLGRIFTFMPRYFFNIRHERSGDDTEGEELPDQNAAWREATSMAAELLRDIDGKLRPGQDVQLVVTDEFRNRLYVIRIIAERCV